MKKTLLILAHPDMENSKLNRSLIEALGDQSGITLHDLYRQYPHTDAIDIEVEQALLLSHERIVFQFPLYWFSTPSLLKLWQDRVLTYGFAYGKGGSKLAGKEFKVVTTVGSPEEAYQAGASKQFGMNEVLRPLEMMAHFVQMTYTVCFPVYDAMRIDDETLKQKQYEYKALFTDQEWSAPLFKRPI